MNRFWPNKDDFCHFNCMFFHIWHSVSHYLTKILFCVAPSAIELNYPFKRIRFHWLPAVVTNKKLCFDDDQSCMNFDLSSCLLLWQTASGTDSFIQIWKCKPCIRTLCDSVCTWFTLQTQYRNRCTVANLYTLMVVPLNIGGYSWISNDKNKKEFAWSHKLTYRKEKKHEER